MATDESKKKTERDEAGAEDLQVVELDEAEVLTAIARLDLEAALAYRAAAEASEDEEVAAQLTGFSKDHLRHVDQLNGVLHDLDAPPVDAKAQSGSMLLPALAKFAGALDTEALLLALITNEDMTNGTYEMALAIEWDDPVLDLLERALQDERRHLAWLTEAHQTLGEDAGGDPALA